MADTNCTRCYPACPDALGAPSTCEIDRLYAARRLTAQEHEKNIKSLGMMDALDSIASTLNRLKAYTD